MCWNKRRNKKYFTKKGISILWYIILADISGWDKLSLQLLGSKKLQKML